MSQKDKAEPRPVWCVVANVRDETLFGEGARETRKGSKHFAPGAKVYCFPPLWGDGYQNIKVVGHHRGSHGFVTMVLDSKYLTNWRVELAYSPHVIAEMGGHWDGTRKSKELAESIVAFKTGEPVMKTPWLIKLLRYIRSLFYRGNAQANTP